MIFLATKNGKTNKFFLLLFWCCWIRDPRSGIRDKHPGSATLYPLQLWLLLTGTNLCADKRPDKKIYFGVIF
jgi:hypothetical protein